MKIISELNSKAWYRALKIIYILTFISTAILVVVILSATGLFSSEVDNEKSYIKCRNGITVDQKLLKQNGINIKLNSSVDYFLPFSTNDSKIRKLCSGSSFVPDKKNYNFVSVHTGRNWKKITGTLMVMGLIIIFLFEIIKRIFYYIVLGSLRPKK